MALGTWRMFDNVVLLKKKKRFKFVVHFQENLQQWVPRIRKSHLKKKEPTEAAGW